jgi:hypothetical protein
VHDPIGERERPSHPLRVTGCQHNDSAIAPFDAALPYPAAAALRIAIGGVLALLTSFRLCLPESARRRDVGTASSLTLNCEHAMSDSTTRTAEQ